MAQATLKLRTGPRPLGLHLATALLTWTASAAALPLLSAGSRSSRPPRGPKNLRLDALAWRGEARAPAKELAAALASVSPDAFAAAVDQEVRSRLDAFVTGLTAYRSYPAQRPPVDAAIAWTAGTTRLLDFMPEATGVPVLVVPSLVNRAYILDLAPQRSLMRFLAQAGFHPFLMDWDRPGPAERRFALTDYVARLDQALDRVRTLTRRPPAVIGYCMGGLLSLALAQRRSRDVTGLALLATPWDFHAERAAMSRRVAAAIEPCLPVFDALGEMPVDFLQMLFTQLDPFLTARKFRGFARLDPAGAKAAEFVLLEDWLNDGVPLAPKVARECLADWYGRNTPGRGEWRVAGRVVAPQAIAVPALVVVPERDRIVPPDSAAALARLLPRARALRPPLGHIGMVVGGGARQALWEPLGRWLAAPATARL